MRDAPAALLTRWAGAYERTASRWDHLVQEGRVHRSLYTDPAIFAEEMIKVFGGTWVYLGTRAKSASPMISSPAI